MMMDLSNSLHLYTLITGLCITALSLFVAALWSMSARIKRRNTVIQQVMEGSRGARLITDMNNKTVYANSMFIYICSDFGVPGLNALAALFERDSEASMTFKNLTEQASRGLDYSVEININREGQTYWYLISAQPIAGWAGYVHWRVDDVTERRATDREIRAEREKLIDFTDNAPVGFFSVDAHGRFIFINATLARWLGQDIDSLLTHGRLHTYMVEPPDNAEPYDIKTGGGSKQIAEIEMKGPGGKTFLAAINQSVVCDNDGRVRTRGVVNDLTNEQQMSQALQASEDRFQRFFDETPLGIVMLDENGKMKDSNAALSDMLIRSEQELAQTNFIDIVSKNDHAEAKHYIETLRDGDKSLPPIEVGLTKNDNDEIIVQMYASRFKGGHIVLHFNDLTQQKKLEAQFSQSQKLQAVGQLAGGVAHDFNNLLTAMIGYCDLLLLRHKAGDASFGDIMQIKQNANRAANLVRQLLAFSRQQTLRPQVQDVTDILTELSHLIRRLIGANIELDINHGHDLGLVRVDGGQMEQVLINLAVNARDAIEEKGGGGSVSIETSHFTNVKVMTRGGDDMPPGDWVCISVADNGCGMDDDVVERILEPFFTTKDVGQGTGLGLSTVYGIIRQTGGYIHIDSTKGEGTTFTMYLPKVSDEEADNVLAAPVAAKEETQDLTGTARILFVEDEDAVRTFGARALTNKGYEVFDAASGDTALEILNSQLNHQLDLLISDVVMPNMDGPTLAHRVRQTNPDLKIIFISGYTEDKLKDHMGKNISFLAKPFTLKELAEKVKQVLED